MKYNNKSDLIKNNSTVYQIICENKWMDELCSHMIELIKPDGYWSKEKCHEESLKYKTKK